MQEEETDLYNRMYPEMSLTQQAPQHDPVAYPSTQSTSSSGADPETSLAQQGPQHDPVASPSTQSTCSSGGVPETSLAQQAFQYQPTTVPGLPVAFSLTQSTSSSGGDPEISLTQQQPSQEAIIIQAAQAEAMTSDLPTRNPGTLPGPGLPMPYHECLEPRRVTLHHMVARVLPYSHSIRVLISEIKNGRYFSPVYFSRGLKSLI
ncbi:PREDICTED: uncharacterized protein LOC108512273 [Rhinopithecus bieti]|uniref:uncharacterized protein LOC108512273 n=1 Tax=Rhinopithecus bieti TaxID=61621 RepID=UPI00083C6B7F|nr:PREDICTED: uncharacterized protein LOC108512273 [Rhinopithecus bieti]